MRLLDLYCGQGGAAMGYARAGFSIVGVDRHPQPRYPFPFVQADALDYLAGHADDFDAVHASPPCQDHTALRSLITAHGTGHLLADTLDALRAQSRPWIVENVPGAPMPGATVLCGTMFGLGTECTDGQWRQLRRHRLFLSSVPINAPAACDHRPGVIGVYGHGHSSSARRGYKGYAHERRTAMGIDWMNRDGLSQSIPPAYTQHLGAQLARAMLTV